VDNLLSFHHTGNSNSKIKTKSNLTEKGNSNVVVITSTHTGPDHHLATTLEMPSDMKTGGQGTINNVLLVIVGTNNSHQGTIAEMRETDATKEVAQIQVANQARMTTVAATATMVEVGEESSATMVVEAAITERTIAEISVVIVTVGTTTEKSQIESDDGFGFSYNSFNQLKCC
jgi:hypothetical protein